MNAALNLPPSLGLLPGDWKIVRVDELFSIQQGKQVSKTNRIGDNQRPFLRTKNVLWGKIDLLNLDQMHFSTEEENRLELKVGDLLLCEGGSVGRTSIWREQIARCYYQNHLHRLRVLNGAIDPRFALYWFWNAFEYDQLYFGRNNITTIPNMSKSRLGELPIAKPSITEQRRIAAILSTVQRAIEQQERLIALTTELKKALTHKLFTEGIRGEPRKQTEIGPVPESWEISPCEKVCNEITVGVVVKPKSYYVEKGVPAFRSLNVHEDRLVESDLVFSPKTTTITNCQSLNSKKVMC